MKKKLHIIFYMLLLSAVAKTQNNSLVINGAHIVMNGGTFSKNIQLVINQGNQNGIVRNSGHIITESQYNYIRWKTGATTGNYVFPTGYSTTDYLPIGINKTTLSAVDIKVSTWGTPSTNMPFADSSMVAACTNMNSIYGGTAIGTVLDRWWDIVPSSSITADIIINYRGVENTTTNPTAIINAQRWNGGQWLLPFGAALGATTGIGAFTASGISNFSPIVLVNSGGILPIELISFTGECEDNSIHLAWTTVSELNNDYFTIEKSTDAINWESSTTVNGSGTSNQTKNYSFVDETILRDTDVIYYRLKQTDYDGKTKTFTPIKVIPCNNHSDLVVYPNPTTDFIYVQLNGDLKLIEYHLLSIDGKLIANEKINSNMKGLDLSFLATGIYYIKFETSTHEQIIKRVVKY